MTSLFSLVLALTFYFCLTSQQEITTINEEQPTIKCFVSGIQSIGDPSVLEALQNLLNAKILGHNGTQTLFEANWLTENRPIILLDTAFDDSTYSDIAIQFVKPSILYSEEKLILEIQKSLKSILKSDSKKSIVLLLLGMSKTAQQRVAYLLKEAYYLLENREDFKDDDLLTELDAKVLLLKSLNINEMDNAVVLTVQNTVERINLSTLRPFKTVQFPTNIKENHTLSSLQAYVPETPPIITKRPEVAYYDVCRGASEECILWARKKASESVAKLNSPDTASDYAGFVDNLIKASIDLFKFKLENYTIPTSVSKLEINEIKRRVLAFMYPFFRAHVAELKERIRKAYLQQLTEEETEINNSIFMESKLKQITKKYLSQFDRGVQSLVPSDAIQYNIIWSADTDRYAIADLMESYHSELIAQGRLRGILSRGRKPVTVSFHTIAYHPFGRDYKQDVVGESSRDIFEYNSNVTSKAISNVLVSPSVARSVLKKHQSFLVKHNRDIDAKSEFAREMLMFSLSVKNPDVPLMLGRSKKKVGPPKFVEDKFGPERFIDWSIPPLDSVQANLREAIVEQAVASSDLTQQMKKGWENLIRFIPLFGEGLYHRPPVSYGPDYGPYLPESDRGRRRLSTTEGSSKASKAVSAKLR